MKYAILSFLILLSSTAHSQHIWIQYASDLNNFPTKINGISNPSIRTISFGKNDSLWMGCYRDGLIEFWLAPKPSFKVYNDSNSSLEGYEIFHSNLSFDNKSLWYTDYSSTIAEFKGIQKLNIYSFLPDKNEYYDRIRLGDSIDFDIPQVYDIAEIDTNHILFATMQGILSVNKLNQWSLLNTNNSKIPTDTWEQLKVSIETDTIKYGSYQNMLYRQINNLKWEKWDITKAPISQKSAVIKKLKIGPNDTLFAITNQGLIKVKDSTFISISNKQIKSGSLNEIKDIAFDAEGRIWYAFENNGGLLYHVKNAETNEFKKLFISSINSNLPDEVSVIEADHKGNIWVGTDNDGLFLYDEYIPVSIEQSNKQFQLSIYPNPSKGTIKLYADNLETLELTTRIFNTQGKLVDTITFNSNQEIETQLKPGIYILKTEHNAGFSIIKLIVANK